MELIETMVVYPVRYIYKKIRLLFGKDKTVHAQKFVTRWAAILVNF